MKLPNIIWENLSSDDFVSVYSDYCLRVEKMDKQFWWWCITYKGKDIAFDNPKAKTEMEAKLLAEIHLIRHLTNENK